MGDIAGKNNPGRAVLPRCPFIKAWIERHPGYADLVADESGGGREG